jgi:hypothetical protein
MDGSVSLALTAPYVDGKGHVPDTIDKLGESILTALGKEGRPRQFRSERQLRDWLTADKVQYKTVNVGAALQRLAEQGRIIWPEVRERTSRSGWLPDTTAPKSGSLGDEA